MSFKKTSIVVVIFVCVVVSIIILLRRKRKIPASSLDGGLRYRIPYSQRNSFRLQLPDCKENVSLANLLSNDVKHPNVDYTEVMFDDDLQSNSMIGYTSQPTPLRGYAIVNIFIAGDVDPSKVQALR